MNDLVSRQAAIGEIDKAAWGKEWDKALAKTMLESLPSAQPEIIRCKDCAKHNKQIGDYEELSVGEKRMIQKEGACPIIEFRGKAQGHEFDYQFCSYARRKDDE